MLKKTPLFDTESKHGARFTEFAGWTLPLYFSSIIDEHMSVRSSAGLFDISHLGKIGLKGEAAVKLLQYLATIDIGKIAVGKGAYNVFCDEAGGIIDDDIIYRLEEDGFLVITNATSLKDLYRWFEEYKPPDLEVSDLTDNYCLIALQGPETPGVLKTVLNEDPDLYKKYTLRTLMVNGDKVLVMKSGYTGEEGYEILAQPAAAEKIWQMLIDAGVKPAGLGARDTLRLEMGYPLYGRDLTIDTTPLEAGLKWLISFNKGDFVGKEALEKQLERGIDKKLAGFVLDEGLARGDERVLTTENEDIGRVTSGGYSPILKRGIGMAYIRSEYTLVGMQIKILVRGKQLTGRIESRPFVKK